MCMKNLITYLAASWYRRLANLLESDNSLFPDEQTE